MLLRSIVIDHPFLDGNKRMGVATSLVFLMSNGVAVAASDDELIDMGLSVADGRVRRLDVIAGWYEARSLPLSDIYKARAGATLDQLAATLPGEFGVEDRPLLRAIARWATDRRED